MLRVFILLPEIVIVLRCPWEVSEGLAGEGKPQPCPFRLRPHSCIQTHPPLERLKDLAENGIFAQKNPIHTACFCAKTA